MRPVLITGGAGFIGTNLAARLLGAGESVVIYDNFSRAGVEENANWLCANHGERLRIINGDTRDNKELESAVSGAGAVFHFAAQVAVTTSLEDPMADFEVNLRGTMHLLELLRRQRTPPPLLFTSTNKVYGSLPGVELQALPRRYEPVDARVRNRGVGEFQALEFYSPYGCSKGAADQYVLDYARSFGIPAVVFRMSCIYGPHQHGNEDQGWLAHFLICALRGNPITLYGDGRQVRDVLFVEDLVDAMLLARDHAQRLAGQVFNVGGGPANATSLLELIDLISELHGQVPPVQSAPWRVGDQRYYVSDCSKLQNATGWAPAVGIPQGVKRLYRWLAEAPRPVAVLTS